MHSAGETGWRMSELRFSVSLPTDEGFLGRECNNPQCSRYFRVHMDSIADEMLCPYCAQRFASNDLFTKDQADFLSEAAAEKAMEYAADEVRRMFERATQGNEYVTFKPGPSHRAKTIQPRYTEREVDSEIVCPDCGSRFQVDGIFAHCIRCGVANMAVFDANLEVISREVAAASDPQRALRHAYNDLVSMFESICGSRPSALSEGHGSFQDPYEARRFFRKHAKIDLLADLDDQQELAVRRVFHKRHAWQHSRGVITDRYVRRVPEDRELKGSQACLSMAEFESAVAAVRLMLDTLPPKAP